MTAVMTTNIINVNNHFNNVLRKLRAGQTVSSVVREEGWAAPVLEQMQTWYTFDYEDYMSDTVLSKPASNYVSLSQLKRLATC